MKNQNGLWPKYIECETDGIVLETIVGQVNGIEMHEALLVQSRSEESFWNAKEKMIYGH